MSGFGAIKKTQNEINNRAKSKVQKAVMMRNAEVLLDLDRKSAKPLQVQLFDALRAMVLDGRLQPGMRLPSTRHLAQSLGLGRNTITAAYERLAAEGYVQPARGGGTRVSAVVPDQFLTVRPTMSKSQRADPAVAHLLSVRGRVMLNARGRVPALGMPTAFIAGQPSTEIFPTDLWAKLLAGAARRLRASDLGYGHVAGWPELRQAILAQVGAARHVIASPEQVIVTTGTQASLALAAFILTEPGDTVWMEDPGYLGARGAFTSAGNRIIGVPVDANGLDISRVCPDAGVPKLIYITPSHQFPTGVTLGLTRRLGLLAQASQSGAYILEDDYDSEFRFQGRPLSSLQGLALERQGDQARVIYIGTFAKTLFPALRIGFLIVPKGLGPAFSAAARNFGVLPPIQIQAALADFLASGAYAAHIRRMRLIYKRRQEILLSALHKYFPGQRPVTPPEGGMQLAFSPHISTDYAGLPEKGSARGLTLNLLARLYLDPTGPETNGLHLGFGSVADEMIEPSVRILAEICG